MNSAFLAVRYRVRFVVARLVEGRFAVVKQLPVEKGAYRSDTCRLLGSPVHICKNMCEITKAKIE